MGFRIVTGRARSIMPGVTKVRTLSLEAHESEITVPCVSQQKIRVDLRGVVVYKVGDDYRVDRQRGAALPRPARGGARVEGPERVRRPPARDRGLDDRRGDDQRPGQVRPAGPRSLQPGDGVVRARHRQLPDPGDHEPQQLHREPGRPAPGRGRAERPHRARQRRPRGGRGRSRTRAAQIAASIRDTEIKKAGFQAEIDRANQDVRSSRARWPQATARQAVVEEETKVAELQAEQKEQQLQVDVRKPADAEAYRQTTLAAAARDVRIRQAEAEARSPLHAEAAAPRRRSRPRPPRTP